MANILLTETCVRSCPYCFAKQYMEDTELTDALSWDNLVYITDLIIASGERHISLLGGEPLLHPSIGEFIIYLSKRGIMTTVFTSGIMSPKKLEAFAEKLLSFPGLQVSFVVNVNEPRFCKSTELDSVRRFLSTFSFRASLSFNIYRTDFNMAFLANYIVDYNLNRHIRLGIAHPIPGSKNTYIAPAHFGKVKDVLLGFFADFEKLHIEPGFDCGFPMCMFSDEELGRVFKYTTGQCSFRCGPAIDIGTDLSVWSCFPLSNYKRRSLLDFNSFREIIDYYGNEMEKVRQEGGGIYPECGTCLYRQKRLCSGGCLAHILNRYIEEGRDYGSTAE